MRSVRLIGVVMAALVAASPVLAQGFVEEFEDITTLPGQGWVWDNNSSGVGTTSWAPLAEGLAPRDEFDFQGNTTVFPAFSGAGYIADNYNATTGASTISDWLMTPAVTIQNGDTVSFWTRGPDTSNYPDRLQVRMSLNGSSVNCGTLPEDVGDFTTLLLDINPTLAVGGYPNVWTQYVITIAGVPAPTLGRFALRYYVTNGGPSGSNSDYIGVDLFEYTATGGQQAAISLTKTVGTTPGVCAATDSVTVSTGSTVYYCFVATNTGDVTFNFHDLDDDHLGSVLNNFAYVLAPGASSPEVIVSDVVSGPVVNTATWTAADVLGGYLVDDTITYNFEDISTTGTPISLSDDSIGTAPIGFTFDFYDTGYGTAYVSSNGFVSMLDEGDNGCCSGDPIPTAATPNGFIAGWWEDLNPSSGGTIHYQTLGTAPNRYLVVQFTNVPHFGSTTTNVTMQYKLFEDGVIEVHYQAAPSDGGTHTAGIENQDGTVGVEYYHGTAALATPLAVRYTPSATVEASATDTATVQVSDPDITVTPTSLSTTQMTDTTVVEPLTLGNVGTADLLWLIEEAPPIELEASTGDFPRGKAAPSAGPPPEHRMRTAPPGEPNPAALRMPGTFAFSTDAGFSTHVYFDSDTPGSLTALGPATSFFWAGDFVGSDLTKTYAIRDDNTLMTIDAVTGAETSIGALAPPPGGETYTGMTYDPASGNVYATSCNITTSSLFTIDVLTGTSTRIGAITNSPCSIAIAADDAGNLYTYDLVNDTLLSINKTTGAGTVIGSIGFDANYGQGMDYDSAVGTMYMAAFNNASFQAELRAVDLTTGNTTLVGALGTPGSSQLGWIGFQSGGPCSDPADLPWLSVSATSGTIPPAGTANLDVTFDSTGIPVGSYDGVLCVRSNDPDEPLVEVPVSMEVIIPVELMNISIE